MNSRLARSPFGLSRLSPFLFRRLLDSDPWKKYEDLGWYQLCIPGKADSLWQDVAASIPAGIGSTVGHLTDWESGWNFIQSTGGLRPTVVSDSVGIGLNFVSDSLGVTTGVSIPKLSGYEVVAVGKFTTFANQDRFFECRDGGTSDHPICIANGAGNFTVFTNSSGLSRPGPATASSFFLEQRNNGGGGRSLTIAGSSVSDSVNPSSGTIGRIHLGSNYTATNNFADDFTLYFWGIAPYGGDVTIARSGGDLLNWLQADFPGTT